MPLEIQDHEFENERNWKKEEENFFPKNEIKQKIKDFTVSFNFVP